MHSIKHIAIQYKHIDTKQIMKINHEYKHIDANIEYKYAYINSKILSPFLLIHQQKGKENNHQDVYAT